MPQQPQLSDEPAVSSAALPGFYCQTAKIGTVAEETITGGKTDVEVESDPTSAVQVALASFKSPKMRFSPGRAPLQANVATAPVAVKGRVQVKGEQTVPSASSMSHAQFVGGVLDGVSGGGRGFVSLSTKVDDVSVPAGSAPQAKVPVASGNAKQGSLIAFPTAQRHASGRQGAAIEFAKQVPFRTGVEVAGVGGT